MPKFTVTKNMGAALKNLRQSRNVKAIVLAKEINKTGAYISKLEKGDLKTIDCNDFIKIIRKMSNDENEFREAIDLLLKDSSMEFSEEEKLNEEWKLNLDYFYRTLLIPDEYKILIKSKMEQLQINSTELSNYINGNFDIYDNEKLDKQELDKETRNRWIFNNGESYVLMEIPAEKIDWMLESSKNFSCYADMFCILMSLYRLEKIDKENAYLQAHNDLASIGILTIRDTEDIMIEYSEEQKINDLLSQRNNKNLPSENRKLLSELNTFVKNVHSFSIVNINYTNEKMSAINKVFDEDPVIALKLLGTNILPLKDKPTQLKKDFFNALDDLIQEYSSKEVSETPLELL